MNAHGFGNASLSGLGDHFQVIVTFSHCTDNKEEKILEKIVHNSTFANT